MQNVKWEDPHCSDLPISLCLCFSVSCPPRYVIPASQLTGHAILLAMLIVLTTTSNIASAEILAQKIVNAKLAACVQILPQMRSIYFWQGKVQNEPEHMLVIKTIPERFNDLREFIVANHSYDTPEVTAIETDKVSSRYNSWLLEYLT